MSYGTPEGSVSDGRPYFLYLFDNGVVADRITSDAAKILADAEGTGKARRWLPSPVSHETIEQTGNIEKAEVNLEFPISDRFARSLLPPSPLVTTVTIWRGHHSDPSGQLRVVWRGRVVKATSGGQKITVTIESVFTSMRRAGCRARTQRTCRFALYHDGCNLNREDFEAPATVTAINGLVLTVPEAATAEANEYRAGIVNFGGIFGFVQTHEGSELTLVSPIDGLAQAVADRGSASVLIAPGCDLSITRCNDRFDNTLNNGSFPFMPDNNPFSISII